MVEFPVVELDDEDDDEEEEGEGEEDDAAAGTEGNYNCVECTMQFARETQLRQHVK